MILIDMRSSKPLYEQIKESIRSQMVHGALRPGDKLPSVRELAQSAAINPNTIQKAYRDLEAEGLIYTVPGKGCFVAETSANAKENRKQELLKAIRPLWTELRYLGVADEELVRHMKGGKNDDD